MKIDFSNSYQNFAAYFFPWIYLSSLMHIYFRFIAVNEYFGHCISNRSRYICGELIYTIYELLDRIISCKALEMSRTKKIKTSAHAILMMTRR